MNFGAEISELHAVRSKTTVSDNSKQYSTQSETLVSPAFGEKGDGGRKPGGEALG